MTLSRIAADIVFVAHFLVIVIIGIGWLFPSIWYLYMAILFGTLLSELFFSYCILSKWEYQLRRIADPAVEYEYEFASYYTYRLTRGYLSGRFLRVAGTAFVSLSIILNLYFRFA